MTGFNLLILIKMILAVLPFAALCVLYSHSNLAKEYRGHQFLSVILGIVYSITTLIFFSKLLNKFLKFIGWLINYILKLGTKKPALSAATETVASFLKNVDWNIYLIFILNFLLLLAFIIIKKMLLPLFKKVWSNEEIFSSTSGTFYEWVEDMSKHFLKNRFFAVKKLFKVYYVLTCIIVCALFVLFKMYPFWEGFKTVIYPYMTVIVVGEIFFFIDGITSAEYISHVNGDDGSSRVEAVYYPFKKYLQRIFGDYIIGDKTVFPKFNYAHSNSDIVKKYEQKDNSQESKLVNIFFTKKYTSRSRAQADLDELTTTKSPRNRIKVSGIELDESLVDATAKLMNGESVLFSSPFYKDYSDYVFLPLNRALMRGSKVLVMVCRSGIEQNIVDWMRESLEAVINVPEMWKIDYLSDKECFSGEVGVINAADVLNSEILNVNQDFIKEVTEVVIIEPSKFISTAQVSLSVYVSKLTPKAVYYIFDKNVDGLVDTMSHVIKKSIISVTPTVSQRNIATHLMWKADGEQFNNRLFPSVARYLGVGTELMISALRDQIKRGEWLSFGKFPIYEMKWISQQYYKVLCEYATIPVRQEELESRMLFNHDLWGVKKKEYQYLVVEDEFCNMFEVARQFESRAEKEVFLNIISQNYLLREYMYLNPQLFENDPKAIPAFASDFSRTHRNIAVELLLKLDAGFVNEKEVVQVLRHTGSDVFFDRYSTYDVKNALYDLIFTYFHNFDGSSPESFVDERDRYYRLHRPKKDSVSYKALSNILNELKSIYYILEDELDHSNYLESKLYGQVYQSHLPGQHIVINGRYYEILFIGDEHGVVLKRAGDHIHSREYYRQLREYDFTAFEADSGIGKQSTFGKIVLEEGSADFKVSTAGYLLLMDYGNLEKDCFRKIVNGIPDRNYRQKSVIRLTLPGITAQQRQTLCLLLNEIFKTIYPEDCNFICALTQTDEDVKEGLLYKLRFECEELEESIFIVEDSVLDMGLLTSFKRNFKRIMEMTTDYLDWHEQMLTFVPKPVQSIREVIEVPPVLTQTPTPTTAKKSFIQNWKDWFNSKFKKKKPEQPPEPPTPSAPFIAKEDHSCFKPFEESLVQEKLTPVQKKCYALIVEHMKAFEESFTLPCSHEDYLVAYDAVKADYPEFFWMNCQRSWQSSSANTSCTVTLKPEFSKNEYSSMYSELMQKVSSLVEEVKAKKLTAYQTALYVHDYLVDNCEYDAKALQLKNESEDFVLASTAYGCIVDGMAICSGYAAAYQLIMQHLGALCGRTRGGDHIWNYIKIDNSFYYVDVTWDDPISDNKVEENLFDTFVSHEYFCITKQELLKTHVVEEDLPSPEATDAQYNYFVMESLFLPHYDYETAKEICIRSLNKPKCEIKFGSEEELEKAKADLLNGGKLHEIFPTLKEYKYYTGKSKLTLYICDLVL